jgi:hypothetical protein
MLCDRFNNKSIFGKDIRVEHLSYLLDLLNDYIMIFVRFSNHFFLTLDPFFKSISFIISSMDKVEHQMSLKDL